MVLVLLLCLYKNETFLPSPVLYSWDIFIFINIIMLSCENISIIWKCLFCIFVLGIMIQIWLPEGWVSCSVYCCPVWIGLCGTCGGYLASFRALLMEITLAFTASIAICITAFLTASASAIFYIALYLHCFFIILLLLTPLMLLIIHEITHMIDLAAFLLCMLHSFIAL